MSAGGVHHDEMPDPVDPLFEPGGPLAAFAEDARLAGGGPAPAPRPGLLAAMGMALVPSTMTTKEKPMFLNTLLSSLAAKVALALGLATAGVTAAGAAGVLPAAAQHAVATVVEATTPFQIPDDTSGGGVSLSASNDLAETTTTSSTTTSSTTSTSTSVPATTTTSISPTTTVPGITDDGQADNHGACVSAVAQDRSLTSREHGRAVSSVARSDCGKESSSTSTTLVTPTSTTVAGASGADAGQGRGNSDRGSSPGNSGKGK